jgi:hypothetical protein
MNTNGESNGGSFTITYPAKPAGPCPSCGRCRECGQPAPQPVWPASIPLPLDPYTVPWLPTPGPFYLTPPILC